MMFNMFNDGGAAHRSTMAALEDLRAANAELAARVAAYEASEKEEKRRIEKAMHRED